MTAELYMMSVSYRTMNICDFCMCQVKQMQLVWPTIWSVQVTVH